MWLRIVLLSLTSVLAGVFALWTLTPKQAVDLVQYGGYWLILAAFSVFVFVLGRSFRRDPLRVAVRELLGPALLIGSVVGVWHVQEPHEYKIVADEVVLGLTAKQMHYAREATVAVRGYEYAGNFTPMVSYVDKRPLFFPLLLSTVHDLTGFRTSNVFWFNGALSLVFVTLLWILGQRLGGRGAAVAATLLAATVPLIAQNACGAGFELLNLVMVLLTLWLGLRAADDPQSDDRLSAFVLSGVLLAQTRYESVIFVVPVAAIVAYIWWQRREVRLPWPVMLSPVFMVLSPLQYNVFRLSHATWQLNDVAGADAPFGFKYFYDNIGHALNFFLTTDGSQPNSILVAVLGVISVGFFVLFLYRRHRQIFAEQPADAVVVIFILGLLLHTLLMLCYFWGHWDDPIIRRLSLPAHLLLILVTLTIWSQLVSSRFRWKILSGMAAVYFIGLTLPSNAMHRFTQQNFAARTSNWLESYVHSLGDRTALAIDRSAGLMWILNGKSSITSQAVAGRPSALALHFRNHSFDEFFLVQRATPDVKTGKRILDADDDFGDALKLELISERAFAPLYLVRLSRIVGVDEEKLETWAKDRRGKKMVEVPVSPKAEKGQEDQLLLWLRQLP